MWNHHKYSRLPLRHFLICIWCSTGLPWVWLEAQTCCWKVLCPRCSLRRLGASPVPCYSQGERERERYLLHSAILLLGLGLQSEGTRTNAEIVLIFAENSVWIKVRPAAVGCRWLGKENMFHYSIPGPGWEHRKGMNRRDRGRPPKVNSAFLHIKFA